MKTTATWTLLSLCVVLTLTGCTGPLKERILLLEDANQSLSNRLTAADQAIANCRADRSQLQKMLDECALDAEQLRAKLAAVPQQPRPQPVIVEPEPTAPKGWTPVQGGGVISVATDIMFAAGSAKLRPDAAQSLGAIVGELRSSYADKDVLVFGHTDSDPIKKSGFDDNYELSSQRALAVVRHLVSQGISAKRLVACGCGEHRPKVPNTGSSNKAQNRRVQIYAITLDH